MADEKIVLKAACVQAAATLMAARNTTFNGAVDVDECAMHAALLYARVTGIDPARTDPGHLDFLKDQLALAEGAGAT
jgi:hypothetical protein